MAAVLDEAMGAAAWMAGHMVVAAELISRFKKMLPLGTQCVVETRVSSVDGRKVRTEGFLLGEDGTVFTEAEGLFITLEAARFGDLAALAPILRSAKDGDIT